MIENKLYQAAQVLPTPKTSFCEIEDKARISKKISLSTVGDIVWLQQCWYVRFF